MKKQIIISLSVIAAIAAVAVGGTMALFSDTETSNGNIFTAGAIDLKVDHTYASYNGEECNDCVPTGSDLLTNGGFETPALSNGQWQVYPSISGWTGVGAGIEVQNNAAGAAHGPNQLVELDSHGQADNRSGMYQDIVTVPGQKYRLEFWHTPRPGNNPASDNQIRARVTVVSASGTMVDQTIGASTVGSVNWQQYSFDFVALDNSTRVRFDDAGTEADTLGGYLDDVSVVKLQCPTSESYANTPGGTCKLWAEKDLAEQGDYFWNFTDVKPADWGKNMISLHVYSNDAYVCLMPDKVTDNENGLVDPELALFDTASTGELSSELEFFMWNDVDADNTYDVGETPLVPAGTPMNAIPTTMLALSSPAPVTMIGIMWCAGDQTRVGNVVSCDGNGMGNIAQTDKVISDFVATAIQQRNNTGFKCSDLIEEVVEEDEDEN